MGRESLSWCRVAGRRAGGQTMQLPLTHFFCCGPRCVHQLEPPPHPAPTNNSPRLVHPQAIGSLFGGNSGGGSSPPSGNDGGKMVPEAGMASAQQNGTAAGVAPITQAINSTLAGMGQAITTVRGGRWWCLTL